MHLDLIALTLTLNAVVPDFHRKISDDLQSRILNDLVKIPYNRKSVIQHIPGLTPAEVFFHLSRAEARHGQQTVRKGPTSIVAEPVRSGV